MSNALDDLVRPRVPRYLAFEGLRRWVRYTAVVSLCLVTFFFQWGDDIATLWLLLRVLNDD